MRCGVSATVPLVLALLGGVVGVPTPQTPEVVQAPTTHVEEQVVQFIPLGPPKSDGVVRAEWGAHRKRRRDECTSEELRMNRDYMISKNMWHADTVYWEDRVPPSSNCKSATLAESMFLMGKLPQSAKFVLPERMRHLSVVYDEGDSVFVSGMCGPTVFDALAGNPQNFGQAFCDVPEDMDGNNGQVYATMTKHLLKSGIPVTLCGERMSKAQFQDTADAVPDSDRFDCAVMWEAEQETYKSFDWKSSWAPFTHDCQNYLQDALKRTVTGRVVDLTKNRAHQHA